MRVLMFGWEFPPYKSGGLGTACHQLTKGLAKQDVKVTFIMPVAPKDAKADFVKLIGASSLGKNVKIRKVKSPLTAYMSSENYAQQYDYAILGGSNANVYGKQLFEEVQRYSALAKHIAKTETHDIIHAHDWMTYQAGINAKKTSKKPLVVHLHATEFDRTGGNPDPRISHIEYLGMKAADKIVTNSNYTKDNITKHYQIPPDKIEVVYFGMEPKATTTHTIPKTKNKTVLFLGRVTLQKGPDYFIETANKTLAHEPNTRFVIVGAGDMLPRIINRAAELGIADKVTFTGALQGEDVNRAFQTADLFVMPSVSEPFGLVALESLQNGTPVLISKTSGVSEVLSHALKVDFWDINEMTNKIVSALRHQELRDELKANGARELSKLDTDTPAANVKRIYENTIKRKY